jgi:hypothetical protein
MTCFLRKSLHFCSIILEQRSNIKLGAFPRVGVQVYQRFLRSYGNKTSAKINPSRLLNYIKASLSTTKTTNLAASNFSYSLRTLAMFEQFFTIERYITFSVFKPWISCRFVLTCQFYKDSKIETLRLHQAGPALAEFNIKAEREDLLAEPIMIKVVKGVRFLYLETDNCCLISEKTCSQARDV